VWGVCGIGGGVFCAPGRFFNWLLFVGHECPTYEIKTLGCTFMPPAEYVRF